MKAKQLSAIFTSNPLMVYAEKNRLVVLLIKISNGFDFIFTLQFKFKST